MTERTHQLRVYTIRDGAFAQFVDEWRAQVVPLRRRFGFEILGAWGDEGSNTFVWIIAHDGDFAARDAEYYASPEREALDPDPARNIASSEKRFVSPVEL
jgi:hypothetical protein